MSDTKLSHRERVRLALEHQTTDRIPIALVCSAVNDPVTLERYLREERGVRVEDYFKPILDIVEIKPRYCGPRLKAHENFWSVVKKEVSFGNGFYEEIDYYPLASARSIDDLKKFRWPSTDWFDYASIPEQIEKINEEEAYCITIKGGNIFETSWYMRGFEQSLMDMAIDPEYFSYIMENVAEFYIQNAKKILEASGDKVDLMFTADDLGGQDGLLISLEMWEQQIKPYHKKLNDVIHQYGATVIYHSDGSIMEVIPGLIDMGIDVLQALQFDAKGMDPKVLKDTYGDSLCFEGGVSVQKTLPFGTPDDVRRETRELISILGAHGGYICGPSHKIQVGTPPENIVALFDTAMNVPAG